MAVTATSKLTQARLKEVLSYDPETGIFRWRQRTGIPEGKIAGCATKMGGARSGGYNKIRIDDILHRSCRLAWLYVYGVWPSGIIDHVDMNRKNDCIANLREATISQNLANSGARTGSTLGIKGVSYSTQKYYRKKYIAQIYENGSRVFYQRFLTLEEAKAAYDSAARETYGEFARP